jgi:copper(I)-binding protein
MSTLFRTLLVLLVAAGAPASGATPLAIRDAWVRATPPGARTAAAYLTIENRGGADRLLGATSDAARALELHTHVTEAGLQRMIHLHEIEIPAGATIRFEPGALHVMLIDIATPLAPGAEVVLRLTFAHSQPIDVVATVIDARTAPGHAAH